MADHPPRLPIGDWRAERLRITLFVAPEVFHTINPAGWWQSVAGVPPEQSASRPRQNIVEEAGPFEGGKLLLSVQPMRVDWNYVHDIAADVDRSEMDAIGPYTKAVDVFLGKFRPWLESSPPAIRVAFGVVALVPVDDRTAGYRQLLSYLPFDFGSEGASDFSYQINRPRTSRIVQGLRLNRLSKWSVAQAIVGRISVGPSGVLSAVPGSETYNSCRVEVDINTDAGRTTQLPAESMLNLFSEMTASAREILEQGDVR